MFNTIYPALRCLCKSLLGIAFFNICVYAQDFAIQPKYDYAAPFSEGVALVRQGNSWFYIDKFGKKAITPQKFDSYNSFSDGMALVWAKGKAGYIDRSGKTVIEPRFVYAKDYKYGRAIVSFEGGLRSNGVIDKSGKFIINPYVPIIFDYSDALAVVNFGYLGESTVGVFNLEGEVVIPGQFEYISPFQDGLAAAKDAKGGWGLISRVGKWVLPPSFGHLRSPRGGLSVFGTCGGRFLNPYDIGSIPSCKYGYINTQGEIVIPPQFKQADDFSDDRAVVSFNYDTSQMKLLFLPSPNFTFGFIDKSGKLIIDPIYSEVYPFKSGVALVREALNQKGEGKYKFIDKFGKPITEYLFDYASAPSEGVAAVQMKSGKWGYIKLPSVLQ